LLINGCIDTVTGQGAHQTNKRTLCILLFSHNYSLINIIMQLGIL
jgi:hypothetical protein